MNILAVDVGTKRWGLAWTDTALGVVLPYGVVVSVAEVVALVQSEKIGRVVLGLPLDLNGQENDHTAAVRAVGEQIVEGTDVAVEYVDERFSSRAADRFEGGGASRDERAAMIILQAYLDKK